MITTMFFAVITTLIKIITFLIPNWFIPDFVVSGFNTFIYYAMQGNELFPIGAVLTCLSIIIWYRIMIIMFRVAFGIITIFRGGGQIPD